MNYKKVKEFAKMIVWLVFVGFIVLSILVIPNFKIWSIPLGIIIKGLFIAGYVYAVVARFIEFFKK